MRLSRVYTLVIIAVLLVIFSLVFVCIGIATPSESFDEQSGFDKVFASSPEFSFDSGSLVMSCGRYSLSLNLGFDKPFLSLLSEGGVLHVNIILVVIVVLAMLASCMVPEISIATSGIVAIFVGIVSVRMIPMMKQQIADGAPSWDVAAGCFWFVAFLFALLIVNGMIGIGGKILRLIFLSDGVRIVITLLVSMLLANAVALILCLFLYLTVGLGFCGGIILWFVVTVLFVAFCEIMDIVAL